MNRLAFGYTIEVLLADRMPAVVEGKVGNVEYGPSVRVSAN
jgi:hypothetical protein